MFETLTFLVIILLAVMGLPLFIVMALGSLVAFYFAGIQSSAVSVSIYQISAQPILLTVPLFTFAGYMMAKSHSPERILRLAQALLGWFSGGVAIMSLIVCAFFTAFTGASGVTIIALGGLLYPILKNEGYQEKFSLGLITVSGSLGLLFPPSLPIIIYGLVAKVDIDDIFRAGLIPGIFLIMVLGLFSMRKGGRAVASNHVFSWGECRKAFLGSFWELLLPVGVLFGIYGGITTVTEAAAFTALYVFIMECFIYRDVPLKKIPKIVNSSMSLVGALLLILCCALAMTGYLVDEEIPMKLLALIKQQITSKYLFLIFLNIFLLIVGCMMDIFSAIIVVVPLIVPIATEYGIHPVHLAIIFLTNLEIGYMTPPVGINLFISSFRFKRPVTDLYKASVPFLILLLGALIVITYIPFLSLFLVK